MNQESPKPFFSKIFSLIIRIRENERRPKSGFTTALKYKYYNFRDRTRINLGLYAAKFIFSEDKASIAFLTSCYRYRHISQGQLFQDILAYFVSPITQGYFVEFGATDGLSLSNTFLLEKEYGWKGLLAEPAKLWADRLKANRGACAIDFRCVWSESGKNLNFVEDTSPEISGVSETLNKSRTSENSPSYMVETVSLIDLLNEHHAPAYIDFMSIDTEGSEFEILEHFDFSKYRFGLIVVEHNYEKSKREKLLSLLSTNQYKRIFPDFSSEDDWYVPLAKQLN